MLSVVFSLYILSLLVLNIIYAECRGSAKFAQVREMTGRT